MRSPLYSWLILGTQLLSTHYPGCNCYEMQRHLSLNNFFDLSRFISIETSSHEAESFQNVNVYATE